MEHGPRATRQFEPRIGVIPNNREAKGPGQMRPDLASPPRGNFTAHQCESRRADSEVANELDIRAGSAATLIHHSDSVLKEGGHDIE
eukprot:8925213-Pyramimonas_sp.AAC.1